MAKGVLLHRIDSPYDDTWDAYHFPKSYLTRIEKLVGDWVIFMEPVKAGKRGYYAVSKIESVRPDPAHSDFFYADMETPTYLDFDSNVPFQIDGHYPEASILNERGNISGRAQAAVRLIPDLEFHEIVSRGLEDDGELPRDGKDVSASFLSDERVPFEVDQDREKILVSRTVRDRAFRRRILKVYDKRCAFTGFQWINGGGRAEVQAAHIKPVEASGPDSARNGLALSGTVHWMFDRGLLGLDVAGNIMISNQVNDVDGVRKLIRHDRKAFLPKDVADRPHPSFLDWHRLHRFKGSPVSA